MSKWVVRKATEADRLWALAQGVSFLKYIDMGIPIDYIHLNGLFDRMLGDENFYVLVVEYDGELRGMAAGYVQPHLFNPKVKMFTELLWWVPEQYRHTRAGAILLDAIDKVGSSVADLVVLSLEHKSQVNHRSLEKRGFEMKEMSFVKRIEHASR